MVTLKSFADAVKVSAPTPSLPTTPPQKPKPVQPPTRGERLLQAVVHYQGCLNPKDCPSFSELIPSLNNTLHSHPTFSHIRVVGMKWTQASNLLVRTQAPFPHVLVAVLEAVRLVLIDDQMIIKDIIPNARWSHVTLSHVYSGKSPNSITHSLEAIHEELSTHNPSYAALMIRQLLSCVCNPGSFNNGQISSVAFAFEDPDGSRAHQLIRSSLTAFSNLRCSIKPWAPPKKSRQKHQPPPVPSPADL